MDEYGIDFNSFNTSEEPDPSLEEDIFGSESSDQ
jgi:hypothetical protein